MLIVCSERADEAQAGPEERYARHGAGE